MIEMYRARPTLTSAIFYLSIIQIYLFMILNL